MTLRVTGKTVRLTSCLPSVMSCLETLRPSQSWPGAAGWSMASRRRRPSSEAKTAIGARHLTYERNRARSDSLKPLDALAEDEPDLDEEALPAEDERALNQEQLSTIECGAPTRAA